MRMSLRCWQWIQVALLASQLPLVFPLAAQAAEAGVFVLAQNPLTLRLVASKEYKPPRRFDAEIQLERVFRFTIPDEIPVIEGNAGHHRARLSFQFSGQHFTCVFRGDADQSHPSRPRQSAKGRKYLFQHCTHPLRAGDEVAADFLRLSILNGDQRAGTTTIELVLLDLSAPTPPPVSELAHSGLDKARSGDDLAAIEDYNRAIQQDPRDAYAYAFRSQSLRALGDETGAQTDIERVLQLRLEKWDQLLTTNPNDADAYVGRAATRLSLGDTPGAIDDYTTSLQLRPGHAPTMSALGNARYRAGDKSGARAEYDQALAVNPTLVEGYVARALVRLELGDVEGAEADSLTARLLAPDDQVSQ
jgi:tetratricopeptide (TPR) repeat protein